MRNRGFMSSTMGIVTSVCALAVAGAVWGIMGGGGPEEPESTLPAELSAEALKKQISEGPGQIRETMRKLRDREDLTEEQRRELRGNMRQAFVSTMDERVDDYFAAKEEDRNAILDKQIDEFQKMRKEWEERRKEREREGNAENNEERRERMRRRFGSQTREERKERSESRSAESSARRGAYFQAMRARATERGIEMGGRGFGRGGRGGGRTGH